MAGYPGRGHFFPAWGFPETALRYLFIAAAACFPVALVFGWFYDITSSGIARTEPARDTAAIDLRLKRVDYVILLALFSIGLAILFGSLGKIQEEIETSPDPVVRAERMANSIAVLSFTNLDTNPETGFFSDGVTEEILHRLSTLGALHVLASTSSFAFRNSGESPANISEILGVRYVPQGSVPRDEDYVRVTARLVDEGGFQVWSESFDRKLESIFVIQTEIASAVSSRIVNEIVPPQELPAGRTTENMEAYTEYLRGRAHFDARTSGWQKEAESAFRRAIELDAGFAPPYAGLATLVVNSGRGPHWDEARASAERALQLDPDLPFGHAVLGLTQAVLGDDERGLESLRRAIELDPSLAIAYTWITMPLTSLGRRDEAVAMMMRGLEIDPLNPVLLKNVSNHESMFGNLHRAEQLLLRLTKIPNPARPTYRWLYLLYSRWGRYADAVDAVDAAKKNVRLALRNGMQPEYEPLFSSYAQLGLRDDADYWFAKFRSQWPNREPPINWTSRLAMLGETRWLAADLERSEVLLAGDTHGDIEVPWLLSYGGLAWIQAGNLVKGIDWLERGVGMYQQHMRPNDPPKHIDLPLLDENWDAETVTLLAERLAFAYQRTGRDLEADEVLQFLVLTYGTDLDTPPATSATGPWISERRALADALAGDLPGAIDHLREALDLGWANYYLVVNDPVWSDTIKSPEFEELLAEAMTDVERQREIVVAADAEHDFRAEVEEGAGDNLMTR